MLKLINLYTYGNKHDRVSDLNLCIGSPFSFLFTHNVSECKYCPKW